MNAKVLVTFATWAGATRSVGEAIGRALRDDATEVDVLPVADVEDVSSYDAVIAGTGIHAGKVHRGLVRFVKHHQQYLSRIPVAYFVVCLTMKDDTEENRAIVTAYLDRVLEQVPEVDPVEIGLFAGAVLTEGNDYEQLSFIWRKIVAIIAQEADDHRDWAAIHSWTVGLRPALLEG